MSPHYYPATTLIIAAAVIAISASVSAAQTTMAPEIPAAADSSSPAPAPSVDCLTQLLTLSDCLSYVLVGSKDTKPDKACCPELAGLVENYPTCICTLFTLNASSYGLEVDYGRAFGLPSACSVSVPPAVTSCVRDASTPVGAPSPSQAGGGGTAAGPDSGEGGMIAPSPANSEAGGGGGRERASSHSSPTAGLTQLLFTGATTGFLLLQLVVIFA
ncbi:Non-specific lipid transfer protein GPI-anchored 12 [Linum grandiflorum]